MKRVENDRDLAISSARSAANRYRDWDGQDDYDRIMEDDWLYQNIGDGSRIQSIPAFGGNPEYTFKDYVEDTLSELSPFARKPSRDELVTGFAKMRKEAEAAYNEMMQRQKEDAERAAAAREELEKPSSIGMPLGPEMPTLNF